MDCPPDQPRLAAPRGAFHFLGLSFLNLNPNPNLNLRPLRAEAAEIKITIKIKRGTQKSEMHPAPRISPESS
ncbi:MAG: hypothetical protein ABSG04_11110 [Verrucomicrobiota bacterium]